MLPVLQSTDGYPEQGSELRLTEPGFLAGTHDWIALNGRPTADAASLDVPQAIEMESTGVYWIARFELLDARGFKVLLVNARHVKNVSGRKSDVLDYQWLRGPGMTS